MKLLRGLLLKPTLNLLSWILRHRNGNSVIIGGPLGWEWYSTIDTTHHGSLAGPANAHRHSDLADIGIDNHHARDHPTEHQDGGTQEISIAGLSGEPAELTTHKGLPDVHHTKFTITEHDVVERHPLAVLDPTVCSETEADGKITTHKGDPNAHHTPTEVGGLYGINVETLAADKTLTPDTDKIYQYLDEGGANRIITLATAGATAGDRFVIRHNGVSTDSRYLEVKQGAVSLDRIYAGAIKEFIFDGTNWISGETGSGEDDARRENVAVGYRANANSSGTAVGSSASGWGSGVAVGVSAYAPNYGVAVGHSAQGSTGGTAVGYGAQAYTQGVAVGYEADGHSYGVAVGYEASTSAKKYSIVLGKYSVAIRVGETSININGNDWDQENNVVQGRWEGELAGGAGATEIFCAGQINQRFTIRPNSVLAFKMTIVARDNVANEVAMYTVEDGLIKRDGANNTVMVNCTVTVVHEDDAAWACAVTADDVNEALIITVTGDGVNITQWAAVMNGVETHF